MGDRNRKETETEEGKERRKQGDISNCIWGKATDLECVCVHSKKFVCLHRVIVVAYRI